MELKELKCKNCGASLKVENDKKEVTCKFCNTTFAVETAEKTGYEFEKGRIKAQKEEASNSMKSATNALADVDGNKVSKSIGLTIGIVAIAIFVVVAVIIFFVFTSIHKSIDSMKDNDVFDTVEVEDFNGTFELYSGTVGKLFVEEALDTAIKANKKGKHKVTVIYNDIKTTDTDEITKLKQSLESNKTYEVEYDYDEDGFINKLTLSILE